MTITREVPTEKRFDARIKAAAVLGEDGSDQGLVTAYVSVFGNKDSYGDIVVPGAFADDIAAFEAGTKTLPVIWSHQKNDPNAFVGDVVGLVEDEVGLLVTMQFDIESDYAMKCYRLVKSGRVNQWSFGYRVTEGAWVETTDEYHYELRKVELFEVGPTLVGANSETRTVEVKSAERGEKAGRTISAATRTALESARAALVAANEEIDSLLALTDDGKAANEPAKSAVTDDKAAEAPKGKAPEVAPLTAEEASRVARALGLPTA